MVALLLASSQIVTSQLAFLSKLDLPLPGLSLSLLYRPREIPIKEPRTFGKKKREKKKEKRAWRVFFFQRGSSLSEILYSPPISFAPLPPLPLRVLLSFFPFSFLFFSFPFLLRLEDSFLRALFLSCDKSIKNASIKRIFRTRPNFLSPLLLLILILFLLKEKEKNELEDSNDLIVSLFEAIIFEPTKVEKKGEARR